MINLIAAIDEMNQIGYKNKLLGSLPNDLKHFRELTEGHFVVMGRNTYESIGKPLPNRTNVVLSRNTKLNFDPEVSVYQSVEEIIHDYEVHAEEDIELFICGGQKVYEEFLPIADRIYLTIIHTRFPKADTYFPRFSIEEFKPVERLMKWSDDKHEYDYTFVTYERKNKTK